LQRVPEANGSAREFFTGHKVSAEAAANNATWLNGNK
jgi:hypothetical protein